MKVDSATTYGPSCVQPTGATNALVTAFSYSKPYEQWKAGDNITITVSVTPKEGYTFAKNTSFTTSAGSVNSYTKSGDTRTVSIKYVPDMRLAPPSGFITYENDSSVYWVADKNAKRFRVTVYNGSKQLKSEIVTDTSYDLSEYLDNEDYENPIRLRITALAAENRKNLKESEAVELNDMASWLIQNAVPYSFDRENGKVSYDKDGWQTVAGHWYYFKKGTAKSGWVQDGDYWYYLDPISKEMQTGYVVTGGKTYFLNDGSVSGKPFGAWIESR